MPKVSRPLVYTVLAAIAVYAVFLQMQPSPPVAKHLVRASSTAGAEANADGVTDADRSAHFPRYIGGKRDPFVAAVSTTHTRKNGDNWLLTGINSVNGVRTALVENSATGESVFLSIGDRWNGSRVVAIDPEFVELQNAFGQTIHMPFNEQDAAENTDSSSQAFPSLRAIRPLPPLPTPPATGTN